MNRGSILLGRSIFSKFGAFRSIGSPYAVRGFRHPAEENCPVPPRPNPAEVLAGPEAASTPTSGEARPRDARRRQELIGATIQCIAEHGLSGTTVARVARRAGLSTGIVNFYFRGKDALLLATLEYVDGQYMLRQRDALLAHPDSPVESLEAMIEAAFDPELCHPDRVAVWAAFWGEARAREDYMRVCAARESELEEQRIEAFAAIAEAGGYTHLETEALGRAFHHLLSSLPESQLGDEGAFDLERARATCRGFLSSIFPAEFSGDRSLPISESRSAPHPGAFETLPTWIYHDPEFFELEKESIFRRHWLMVGHASHVAQSGDYLTADLAGERVFVIRGGDGVLRAFDNVCRHRASRVVQGQTGNCPGQIVCPYHGWRYGFDGTLKGVPEEGSFSGLEKSEVRLPGLDLEEWMGFIFVRFASKGESVADLMAARTEEASHYRFAQMQPLGPIRTLECDFNWKFFVENDSEGYHIPMGHPGLRRLFGDSYEEDFEIGEGTQAYSVLRDRESSVWSERAYQRLLPEVPHLPEDLRRAWVYYGLFPSAVVQACPDVADCYQVVPTGPESCQIQTFRVGLPDSRREMRVARYLSERIIRSVVDEDLALCRFTNEGVKSGRYAGGYLSKLESGVGIFRDELRELIPVARLWDRPARGRVATVNAQLKAGQMQNLVAGRVVGAQNH